MSVRRLVPVALPPVVAAVPTLPAADAVSRGDVRAFHLYCVADGHRGHQDLALMISNPERRDWPPAPSP